MKSKFDQKGRYIACFDEKSGFYLRTGVIDENSHITDKDPFRAEFPELLDVGIMGHCLHGSSGKCLQSGVQCYQNGLNTYMPNMSVSDFEKIAAQCQDKTFQFALGGRGDPDQHEDFQEILEICHQYQIVPNYTSSGFGFNQRIVDLSKKYCGAVAISWYRSSYTLHAINLLLRSNVKTNIHYVLSDSTIDEAITRLKNNDFPAGINAVIFLLHKPIGLGQNSNVLKASDKRVKTLFTLIDQKTFPFKIGFDACSVPGLISYTSKLRLDSLDTCEAARWSAYISSDMKMMPCSFAANNPDWHVDLNEYAIQEVWESEIFEKFRQHFYYSCPACRQREHCLGGCPICPEIVLCEKSAKEIAK